MQSAIEVAKYISTEMIKNAKSPAAERVSNNLDSISTTHKAFLEFKSLVGYGRPWDHKLYISETYGKYSLDPVSNEQIPWDVWSNIHYGYIGKRIGFSKWTLLSAAGIAQFKDSVVPDGYLLRRDQDRFDFDVFSALDDPRDQVAIKIGIFLWDKNKLKVNHALVMDSIRVSIKGLI
jgi:hypothetical protein